MNYKLYGNNTFTVESVLLKEGCQHYIDVTEKTGYNLATVNMGNDTHLLNLELRNNSRVNIVDEDLAKIVWDKIRQFVPPVIGGQHALGLDTTFRCYRYNPGEYFNWHVDGATKKDGNQSKFTILIYLNDEYTGGETEFEANKVKGTPGGVLVFPHKTLHRGVEVAAGTKYVMRSDIMFGNI